MHLNIKYVLGLSACAVCALQAQNRPDYYTTGFYTRGVDEAANVDMNGVISPFVFPGEHFSIIPRATLEVSSDDNYFIDETGEQRSTETSLMPGVLFVVGRQEHNHFYFDVGADIPLRQSLSRAEDNPSLFGKAGVVYQTGKSQFSVGAGCRRDDQVDRLVGERLLSENRMLSAALEHQVTRKTKLGLNGHASYNDYDSDAYSDYHRFYGAARIYLRSTMKSELYVQGGLGSDYADPNQSGASLDASYQDLSVGMRGQPTPKTSINGSIGYRLRQHEEERFDDANTWVANLGGTVNPFGLSRFSLELMADGHPDISGFAGTAWDRRVSLGVDRRLFSERLRGAATVQYGEVEYYGEGSQVSDGYWGYSVGLDWWTRYKISFGASYSYMDRDGEGRSGYSSGRWALRSSWNY